MGEKAALGTPGSLEALVPMTEGDLIHLRGSVASGPSLPGVPAAILSLHSCTTVCLWAGPPPPPRMSIGLRCYCFLTTGNVLAVPASATLSPHTLLSFGAVLQRG